MNLDDLAENVFYYGFIAWCVLLIYLSLGNGVILAFTDAPHLYTAAIRLPDWILFSGLYLLFIFSTVTTENQKKHEVTSLLAFLSSLILLIWAIMDAIMTPTVETLSKAIGLTIGTCGTGYWFISTWRKH